MPARLARSDSQTDLSTNCGGGEPTNRYYILQQELGALRRRSGLAHPDTASDYSALEPLQMVVMPRPQLVLWGRVPFLLEPSSFLSPCFRPGHKTYICSIGCRDIGTVTTCPFCNLCDLGHAVLPRNQRCALGRRRNCGDLIDVKRVGRFGILDAEALGVLVDGPRRRILDLAPIVRSAEPIRRAEGFDT